MNPETRRRSNRTDPPRAVPLLVRLRLMFGGTITQCGWAVFAFGMLFFWGFVANSDLTSWYRFRGPLVTVQGQVTNCINTRFSKGENGESRICAISYRFVHEDSQYTGTSYDTPCGQVSPGQDVTIEFPQGNPAVSRIRGMRMAPCDAGAALMLIFPLLGGVLLTLGLFCGWRAAKLLASGRLTNAMWIGKEPIATSNNQLVYRVRMKYVDSENSHHWLTVRTTQPEKIESTNPIQIVFDPRYSERAVALVTQPGWPFIDTQTGQVLQKDRALNLCVLFLPGITLLGNAACIIFKYL